jgi:CelD/BcsL family acetyltransferase involved in cellulose biosynthesis
MHAPLPLKRFAEWRKLSALAAIADEWRDLAGRALQPNVFYDPAFFLAAAPVFAPHVGALLVRDGQGRLIGFFPARMSRTRYGLFPPVLTGFVHPFAPLGLPLVDRDAAAPAIEAWLAYLATQSALPRLVLLPFLPEQGPFADALNSIIEREGLQTATFGRHARALLEPGNMRADYVEHAVSAKARKELARKRRRLAEIAPVEYETVTDPAQVKAMLARFLALEAGGWKGRAGTAAQADPRLQAFMEQAVTALAERGQARGDIVRIGDCPLAIALMLRSGDTMWAWKIAYDERFFRFSPGVQLALDITRALVADNGIARTDSCATPDHPMIDHIWRERLTLSDRLICVRPGASSCFALACRLESLRRRIIAAAKDARTRWHALTAFTRYRATTGE